MTTETAPGMNSPNPLPENTEAPASAPVPPLQTTRQDTRAVRSVLNHLTAGQKLVALAGVVIVAWVWWKLINWLLAFGDGIDYSGLQAMGTRTVDLLQHYNPFFWWGLVALVTLILLYLVYGFVAATQRHVRTRMISHRTAQDLVQRLSPGGREVLAWAWQDRRHPVTIGVLQRTLAELRSNRAAKITLARQHAQLLDPASTAKSRPDPLDFYSQV